MAIAIRDDVGLPHDEVERFSKLEPTFGHSLETDVLAASRFFAAGQALIERLPPRPRRAEAEQAAAEALHAELRDARVGFLRRHAGALYAQLTEDLSRFARIEDLVYDAAEAVPGLVPTRAQIRGEREQQQKDK